MILLTCGEPLDKYAMVLYRVQDVVDVIKREVTREYRTLSGDDSAEINVTDDNFLGFTDGNHGIQQEGIDYDTLKSAVQYLAYNVHLVAPGEWVEIT